MSRASKLLLLALAVVLTLAVGWLGLRLFKSKDRAIDSFASLSRSSLDTSSGLAQRSISPANVTNPAASVSPSSPAERHAEKLRRAIEPQNVPISFWGKVIDQDGQPLSGVKVKCLTRRWTALPTGIAGGIDTRHVLETDAEGRFVIGNARGDILEINSIEKDGYELSHQTRSAFRYSGLTSDPSTFVAYEEEPVVFRMWKRGTPVTLVHCDMDIRIPYNGTPVGIDLLEAKKLPGNEESGDIHVTLLRTPLQIIRGRQKFDWAATIEPIGGGIIQSGDEFMYQAPETGCQPKIEVKMPADSPEWSPKKTLTFYLASRNGRNYGRVTVQFRTDSDRETTGFSVEAYVNPAGSRNLESGGGLTFDNYDAYKKYMAQHPEAP